MGRKLSIIMCPGSADLVVSTKIPGLRITDLSVKNLMTLAKKHWREHESDFTDRSSQAKLAQEFGVRVRGTVFKADLRSP